jgi:1,2-diacylglycerol 3-alpha-glucosyltransferase
MKLERIVFVHPFLLHYHFPRLQVLAEDCCESDVALYSIELASYVNTYRSFFEEAERKFDHITLFPEQSFESIPENGMWASLENKLKEIRPNVAFIYGYSCGIMRRVKSWAESNKVAIVLISDSNEFDKRRYRLFEFLKSLFVSRIDAAFVGGTSSSLYLQKLKIPKERIVFGYDVVDNVAFCQQAQRNKRALAQILQKWDLPENYFLYVGRMIKEKNVRGLLDAYMEYARSVGKEVVPWSLVLCGNGPQEEELRQYTEATSDQSGKSILFYGLVKQPDIIDFYSGATCLVLPSISESWGLVVNEAMACGLPVIASKQVGCTADLVKDGVTGWLFDPHDTNALTRLMLNIHRAGSSARIEMGMRAERLIAEWGLAKFSQGALASARIAVRHRQQRL